MKGDVLLEALAGDREVARSVKEILRLHRRIAELEVAVFTVESEQYGDREAMAVCMQRRARAAEQG